MKLRPYQQAAHDAAITWVKRNTEPCVIEAATGAGKSHIISALAKTLHQLSGGKHILCLQPSKELLEQNYAKFVHTGDNSSMFSASVGITSLRWPVVYGTPMTVKNKIHRFGSQFCVVILDECHSITPTIKHIIEELQGKNSHVRVIGLSATPYRLGTGYLYAKDDKDRLLDENQARDPYFKKLVYKIGARQLIAEGFLTQPVISETGQEHYDTLGLQLNSRGQFDAKDVDRAYMGHGRKTAAIVHDVVTRSQDRQGVLFFAATVRHAQEILASLPPGLSAIVTGETPKDERASILRRFKRKELKYIVNRDVLTVGFDAPHIDVIALCRATESVGLLQQMIGRGLRIDDGKTECLVMDYAQNIERHCPDGDLFAPVIRVRKAKGEREPIEAHCPECSAVNVFSARDNTDGFQIDKNGYYIDLFGQRVQTEFGFMPAHYGRRCLNEPCTYRWTSKSCPTCNGDNDITARYCSHCKAELIDPGEKLKIDFAHFKSDPTKLQTDEIISFVSGKTMSRSGNECLRADIVTPYRSFSVWCMANAKYPRAVRDYERLATLDDSPQTVTYKKEDSGFYRILAFNEQPDEEPV